MSATVKVIPVQKEKVARSWVPTALVKDPTVSFQAKALFMALSSYSDRNGKCFPAITTLARHLNVSRHWVLRYLKELIKAKLIRIEKRHGNRSTYTLNEVYNGGASSDGLTIITPPSGSTGATTLVAPMQQGSSTGATTPVAPMQRKQGSVTRTNKQGVRTSGAHTEDSPTLDPTTDPPQEPAIPNGIRFENGKPMLDAAGYIGNVPQFDTDALTFMALHVAHIEGEQYFLPIRAWIETRRITVLPNPHDVRRIKQLVDVYDENRVTETIRKEGDAGRLKLEHIRKALSGS